MEIATTAAWRAWLLATATLNVWFRPKQPFCFRDRAPPSLMTVCVWKGEGPLCNPTASKALPAVFLPKALRRPRGFQYVAKAPPGPSRVKATTVKGSRRSPISMPGEPMGIPGTAIPAMAGRSASSRRISRTGTWPSTA